MTSDADAVLRGFEIGYTRTTVNTTSDTQDFQFWAEVTLPDGSTGVLGPWSLSLAPHESSSSHIAHRIPGDAPFGEYTYEGKVGVYPSEIWDQDSFTFTVAGGWSDRIPVQD
jgi:hypothetical protein